MTRAKERTAGLGCEDQWAMDTIKYILEATKSRKIGNNPLYRRSPNLIAEEVKNTEELMANGKISVKITSFDTYTFMKCNVKKLPTSEKVYEISMRPDVAAMIMGIAGFDPEPQLIQVSNFVKIIKEISKDPKGLLKPQPKTS